MNDPHDILIDQLSEYIDGELSAQLHADIDAHVAACGECRSIVGELKDVKTYAATMPATPPGQDLWEGVATRINSPGAGGRILALPPRASRRFSFTLPELAAAGVALMVMSGGMVWLAQQGDGGADLPAISAAAPIGPAVAPGTPGIGAEPASFGDAPYEGAIEDLERTLDQGRDRLDPETVRVLEQNLETMDQAIDQCRRALEADPSSTYLNTHLAAARQRKLALLRRATALTIGS
ncbi:MAG: zf-HC2 domain-containing protein [Vicinamibacterales bacterium]